MGNQTSQWFALYYLDGLDRLVKEKLGVKYYTKYMTFDIKLADRVIRIHAIYDYIKEYSKDYVLSKQEENSEETPFDFEVTVTQSDIDFGTRRYHIIVQVFVFKICCTNTKVQKNIENKQCM